MPLFQLNVGYVRTMGVDDAPSLQKLYVACADYFFSTAGLFPDAAEVHEALVRADGTAGSSNQARMEWGLFSADHQLIGASTVIRGRPARRDWDLGSMIVAPEHRSRGHGSVFAKALLKYAGENHCRRMALRVVSSNARALAFWNRLGFTTVREDPPRQFGKLHHVSKELVYAFRSQQAA